jgi:hypothetical protein
MSTGESPAEIVERIRRTGIKPGEQRAYIVASVLASITVIVTGMTDPAIAQAMGFETATSLDAALDRAVEIVGTPATAAIVPHALTTLPIIQQNT